MSDATSFGFVVAYVDDIEASKRFYVDVLGLRLEREAPSFVQFGPFAIANDDSMDGRRQTEVYWLVADAEAELKRLRGLAPICMELRALPFGKVFGVADPSGQPRYLLELARNRPSRPTGP
jgi:catechol 2,3-dioxygenase-like lactoylglutathione lyase family enzyme